jgi:hypothetical protein
MNQSPQTGKRIVSKGEYAKAQRKRAALFSLGVSLIVAALGGILAFASILLPLGRYMREFPEADFVWLYPIITVAGLIIFVLAAGLLAHIVRVGAIFMFKKANAIDPGIPIHRVPPADLPAPDSLVRASEEPRQEPQAVLLRAATQTQERHEEQLVRAAGKVE